MWPEVKIVHGGSTRSYKVIKVSAKIEQRYKTNACNVGGSKPN